MQRFDVQLVALRYYSCQHHPEVQSGKITEREALKDFLDAFEGSGGNHDGVVTIDEWIGYYDDLSASIDSDDYFGSRRLVACSVWLVAVCLQLQLVAGRLQFSVSVFSVEFCAN